MTAAVSADRRHFHLDQNISWLDPETECRFVFSHPYTDPALWARYAEGALHNYRAFGVEAALDQGAMATGADTALFFVALDADDQILAGVRAIGPLRSPDDSHAVVEWAGQPGQDIVRSTIAECVESGIMEMKSAWIASGSGRGRALSDVITRASIHMSALLDTRFLMATAASFLVAKWMSAGAEIVPVPATPYPDERFETQMVLWDRKTFIAQTPPEEASRLYYETTHLLQAFSRMVPRVNVLEAS
jgi:hypothetical protein